MEANTTITATQWHTLEDLPDVVTKLPEPGGFPPDRQCRACGFTFKEHGMIGTMTDGHIVCPTSWVMVPETGRPWVLTNKEFSDMLEQAEKEAPKNEGE